MGFDNSFVKVAVVGGINVDIGGTSFAPLIGADSNPGKVSTTLGGVGRNIAHNLRLLGVNVTMLTALGDDANGDLARGHSEKLDIDLSHARHIPGGSTSTYLYITDPAGELALAVSDMSICDEITGDYLREKRAVLEQAELIVADANIPAQALEYLGENFGHKLFADPVSTVKGEKLRPILKNLHTLKPNRLEAELLSGIAVTDRESAAAAARALVKKGVKRVFISLGAQGVCAAEGETVFFAPPVPGNPVNTTGCGDAVMAALVGAELEGLSLEAASRAGMAAGSVAMESELTIAPHMSAEEVKRRMEM